MPRRSGRFIELLNGIAFDQHATSLDGTVLAQHHRRAVYTDFIASWLVAIGKAHLAIQVRDIDEARRFYGDFLGCPEGRSSDSWVDFDLYGHQFVCHLNPALKEKSTSSHKNPVDGHGVPVPHFGVVLEMDAWNNLSAKLREHGVAFEIEP